MTPEWLKDLRALAEEKIICMGLGGEERFVDFGNMVLSRATVLALIDAAELAARICECGKPVCHPLSKLCSACS